jgi:hypothetical protein
LGRRRRRWTLATASLAAVGAGALAVGSASVAQVDDRPVISGEPVVGNTLTSSPVATTQGLYKWQGCAPPADCSDSPDHNDPDWTDLTSASHTGQTYTIPASDLGHFIRVLVHDNKLGSQWRTSVPVGPVRSAPPPPDGLPPPGPLPPGPLPPGPLPPGPPPSLTAEHGLTVLVELAAGSVKWKEPGQAGFRPLSGLEKIPVNSVIDTRGGKVNLTAATGDLGDTTPDQSVQFFQGLFRIQQAGAPGSPAIAKLVEKLRCPKRKGNSAKAGKSSGGPVAVTSRKRRRRRVWGSGSGSYGTAGGGGTGSVRGTTWLTKDTCKGTFFKVTEGIGITVTDFDRGNKQVELGPGQSYFARNR